jgi:hypothetical protein
MLKLTSNEVSVVAKAQTSFQRELNDGIPAVGRREELRRLAIMELLGIELDLDVNVETEVG